MKRGQERLTLLADELRKGNDRVFTEIYEMTQQGLHVYALMLMKDPEKTQDLMQDTYIKIYESAHTLRDPSRFMAWAKRILYTQAMAYYRRSGKDPILVDEDKENIFDIVEEESNDFIPEANLDRAELQRIVFDVVKTLPAEQRVTMVAFYYDEMSVREIAEMMGCSEGTVKSRLFNGRKAFKGHIEAYEKRHNIRLHSMAPFLFAGFADFDKASAATAAASQKTLAAVTAKTGIGNAAGASFNAGVPSQVPMAAPKKVVVSAAAKSAAGISAKKIAAAVCIAALVAGGTGFGIYQGTRSSDEASEVKQTEAEKEPATAEARAMQKYKEYLEKKAETIKGFRVLPLGERIPTLIYSEETELGQTGTAGIVQYYDEDRELEVLGKISSESGSGKLYYKDAHLYAVGFMNGQDASEYQIKGKELSAAGVYIDGSGRARQVVYRGPMDAAGNAEYGSYLTSDPGRAREEVDRIKEKYESSILNMQANSKSNRDKLTQQ